MLGECRKCGQLEQGGGQLGVTQYGGGSGGGLEQVLEEEAGRGEDCVGCHI